MPIDLLGPGAFGAGLPAVSRPALTPSNSGSDTFFKDCTSSTNDDGTDIDAAHLNALLAQLRALIRGGQVTEDNTDDNMILRGARSQRTNWLSAGGTANALTLTPSPSFAAFSDLAGVPMRVLCAAANTAASPTLNVNGLGAKTLKYPDGVGLFAGDLAANKVVTVVYVPAPVDAFVMLSLPTSFASFNAPTYALEAASAANTIASGGTPTTVIASYGSAANKLVDSTWSSGILTIGASDAGMFTLSARMTTNLPKGGTSGTVNTYSAVATIDLSTDSGSTWTSQASQEVTSSGASVFGPCLTPSCTLRLASGNRIRVTVGQNSGISLSAPMAFTAVNVGR